MVTKPQNTESATVEGLSGSLSFRWADLWFGLIMLTLVAVAVFSVKSKDKLLDHSNRTAHANRLVFELQEAHDMMQDAETGVNSYLLTEDPAFLELYANAHKNIGAHMAELVRLSAGNPEQESKISFIQNLI